MIENTDENLIDVPMVEVWRRDYSLNDLPRDKSGKILALKDTEEEFLIYVEWLADYLYNSPPPSPEMLQMIEQNLSHFKSPDHQILVLAFDANLYDYEISSYDDYFEDPKGIDITMLLPEIVKQAQLENEQKRDNGLINIPCANFSDISWRTPLAWILKKVPDKKERIQLLINYFEEYSDLSYK